MVVVWVVQQQHDFPNIKPQIAAEALDHPGRELCAVRVEHRVLERFSPGWPDQNAVRIVSYENPSDLQIEVFDQNLAGFTYSDARQHQAIISDRLSRGCGNRPSGMGSAPPAAAARGRTP